MSTRLELHLWVGAAWLWLYAFSFLAVEVAAAGGLASAVMLEVFLKYGNRR